VGRFALSTADFEKVEDHVDRLPAAAVWNLFIAWRVWACDALLSRRVSWIFSLEGDNRSPSYSEIRGRR
jgi:hypothetical protein